MSGNCVVSLSKTLLSLFSTGLTQEDRSRHIHIGQSVTYLTTEAYLTADPGVKSLIQAWSHTFVEIDQEIISMVIFLPSADSWKKGVISYKRKYDMHEVLANRLFKLAQEKVWLGELTIPT